MNDKDVQKLIEAMAEVFPTAEMMNNAFNNVQQQISTVDEKVSGVQRAVAEVSADLIQLTTTVEALRERVNNVPTVPDMQRLLEQTYNFSKLQTEHDRMKKITQDKLGVEV